MIGWKSQEMYCLQSIVGTSAITLNTRQLFSFENSNVYIFDDPDSYLDSHLFSGEFKYFYNKRREEGEKYIPKTQLIGKDSLCTTSTCESEWNSVLLSLVQTREQGKMAVIRAIKMPSEFFLKFLDFLKGRIKTCQNLNCPVGD